MDVQPCLVCGGKDLNLVDGFYYCVECGTQDTNARETLVETMREADGFNAHIAKVKKIHIQKEEEDQMSPEWHKWHTFNFILRGLVSELRDLGAEPSVEKKVLWIWVKYMKTFKQKEEQTRNVSQFFVEDDDEQSVEDCGDMKTNSKTKMGRILKKKSQKDWSKVSKAVLVCILYIALNLDKSDIQLSHLHRFLRERRLSLYNKPYKFVPQEMDLNKFNWENYKKTSQVSTTNFYNNIAIKLMDHLQLGEPLVPDLKKILQRFVKELCLPNEFQDMVYSLMTLIPCTVSTDKYNRRSKKFVSRAIPDYELIVMSYIFVVLKICFGLDDDYDLNLSKAIDAVNEKEKYSKSHKFGGRSNHTGRLFSFAEWCIFLHFRKTILGKFYLPMAQDHNLHVNENVYMEHLFERPRREADLRDEVLLDILSRIPYDDNIGVIPFSEFPPTLTPFTDYTEVILNYFQDPELKLLLSEDFTQYSLKYVCVDMKLPHENQKLKGVSNRDKEIVKIRGLKFFEKVKQCDKTPVYVRNCDNKNWIRTKPPKPHHVTKADEQNGNKNSDNGYDSNTDRELSVYDGDGSSDENTVDKKPELIEEEDLEKNIFDDEFDVAGKTEKVAFDEKCLREFENSQISLEDLQNLEEDTHNEKDAAGTNLGSTFNPATFNRSETIKELIRTTCAEYKIPLPAECSDRELRKRKSFIQDAAGCSEPKKKKTKVKSGETKKVVDGIISAFYLHMEKDVLNQISQSVKSVIREFESDETRFNTSMTLEQNDGNISETQNEDDRCLIKKRDTIEDENDNVQSDIVITDDLLPKSDPKFDENTYDIKQLYVKLQSNCNIDDYLDDIDPEIQDILNTPINEENFDKSRTDDKTDSNFAKKFVKLTGEGKKKELHNCLIEKHAKLKYFNYWRRHYNNLTRFHRRNRPSFEDYIMENMPKSFYFVLKQCAMIANCNMPLLYTAVAELEGKLLGNII